MPQPWSWQFGSAKEKPGSTAVSEEEEAVDFIREKKNQSCIESAKICGKKASSVCEIVKIF